MRCPVDARRAASAAASCSSTSSILRTAKNTSSSSSTFHQSRESPTRLVSSCSLSRSISSSPRSRKNLLRATGTSNSKEAASGVARLSSSMSTRTTNDAVVATRASTSSPPPPSSTRPPVAVVTTTGCPFCQRVKGALSSSGIDFEELDLASSPRALAAVKGETGRATVPQVFVGGRLVGGCDETLASLADGTFRGALEVATANAEPALPAAVAAAVVGTRAGSSEGGVTARAKAAARAAADDAGLRPEGMEPAMYAAMRAVEAEMARGDGTGVVSGGVETFTVSEALEWLRRNKDRVSSAALASSSSSDSSFPVEEDFPTSPEDLLDALAASRFVAPPFGAVVSFSSSGEATTTAASGALPGASSFLDTIVSALPPETPLLLARRASAAKPPLPLNARISWLGPARSAPVVASGMRSRVLELYDAFLSDDGRNVDYKSLVADPRFADFCCAAAELQALSFKELESLPPAERAALFINVYNAVIVHATAERGAPADSPASRSAFFGTTAGAAYAIAGFSFTADDVEHGILRCNAPSVGSVGGALRLPWATHFGRNDPRTSLALPRLDARIHAALNCGARSCPPIKVYSASSLSEALDGAMAALCGDARVDERNRTVELSMIFKWYARDFAAAGAAPLLPWLARYLPPVAAAALGRLLGDGGPPPKIQYAPYDWGSNDGTS